MCSSRGTGPAVSSDASFSAGKEQAIVLLLVSQLADAQFVRADRVAAGRLWQEVVALDLDSDRLIELLYCGVDPADRDALRAEDNAWLASRVASRTQRWRMGGWGAGGSRHQSRSAICTP